MKSPNFLTAYEVVNANIGTLPSLSPHPTTSKIRALYTHLHEVLVKIPSFQSMGHGYQDMVDAAEIYTLTGAAPWIDFPNPGLHRQADSNLGTVAQRGANAIFSASIIVYTSQ